MKLEMRELENRRELEWSSGIQVKDTDAQGIDLRLDPNNNGKLCWNLREQVMGRE